MIPPLDEATTLLRRIINILLLSNPIGTSLGVLIGVILHGLFGLFLPLLKSIEWIDISGLRLWHLISIGVFSTNVPSYFRRNKIDKSIENAIEFIEKEKKNGNISDWQARKMYADLYEKVLADVVLDPDSKNPISEATAPQTQPSSQSKTNS